MLRWKALRYRHMRFLAVVGTVAALALTACGGAGSAGAGGGEVNGGNVTPEGAEGASGTTTKINVVVSVASIAYSALYIAQSQGFFLDQGITVNITTVSGGGATVPALQSDSAQFGFSSVFHQIDAVQKGQQIVSIGATNIGEGLDVVVSPKKMQELGLTSSSTLAQKGAALKDMKIGVVSTSGEPYYVLADLAKQGTLDPSKLNMQTIAGPAAVTAMQRGQIDGMTIGLPVTTQAMAQLGAQTLISCPAGDLPDLVGTATETILASQAYISSHADVAKRFLAAIARAQQFYTANPDQAAKVVHDGYFKSVDQNVFDTAWKESLKVMPSSPTLTVDQVQRAIDFVSNASGKKVPLTGSQLLGAP